jgi:hypothetical protein
MAMQYELKTPGRSPMPVLCPACGSVVTGAAPTCSACGFSNPTGRGTATLDFGSEPVRPAPHRAARHLTLADLEDEIGDDVPPMPPPPAVDEPSDDLSMPSGLKYLDFSDEPALPAPHRPDPEFAFAKTAPTTGRAPTPLPTLHTVRDPTDYIDSQIGLKASSDDDAVEIVREDKMQEIREMRAARERVRERPVVVDPRARREPAQQRSDNDFGFVVPAAVCFALFSLAVAMLVHAFAPSAVPGYSAPELDLKVQMRAVEWLLAGILFALVGLLVKR